MANNSFTQLKLAQDPYFQSRVKAQMLTYVGTIMDTPAPAQSAPPTDAEKAALNTWTARRNYALAVIANPDAEAARIVGWLVYRTNVNSFETSWDFINDRPVTTSGDADLLSQIRTDWNVYARA